MVGVSTLLEAMQRRLDTRQVTFTTEVLAGNTTHDIELTEEDNKIQSVDFKPSDEGIPSEGVLFIVRPIVDSGSTDTDFFIFEDGDREAIDEVLRVDALSVNDNVQTFQPGGGTGVPFQNQDGEDRLFLRFDELSTNDSQYTVRLRWFDVTD